jgi:hypothetical protein
MVCLPAIMEIFKLMGDYWLPFTTMDDWLEQQGPDEVEVVVAWFGELWRMRWAPEIYFRRSSIFRIVIVSSGHRRFYLHPKKSFEPCFISTSTYPVSALRLKLRQC